MIIDPLRLALVTSLAEVDNDDGAVLIGVGLTEFKGVDVMLGGSEAGAVVDVGTLGAAGRR